MAPKQPNHGDTDKDKRKEKDKDNDTPKKKKPCKSEEAAARSSHHDQCLNLWPTKNMPLCLQQWDEQQKGNWKGHYLSIRGLSRKSKIPNNTIL